MFLKSYSMALKMSTGNVLIMTLIAGLAKTENKTNRTFWSKRNIWKQNILEILQGM